ncbi:MAG TPA: glycosyltransferase family 39 protein [Elusimicrobiota bacterium]|nr:glycosyltransferase family 39 protein [Elusimicrobiota bacterium]
MRWRLEWDFSLRGNLEAVKKPAPLLPAFLLFLYFVLTLSYFTSPGYIVDGLADEAAGARWADELRNGLPFSLFRFNFHLYNGCLTRYLMMPFFYVFGTSWTIVRLWPIVFGGLTLLVTYRFANAAFKPKAGLLALLFLVIHPAYLMGVKSGNYQVSYMTFFSISSLYFLHRWWLTQKTIPLFLATFLLGLGLGTRFFFIWYGAAFGGVFLLALWDIRTQLLPGVWNKLLKPLFIAGLGFLASTFLMWRTELRIDTPTLPLALQHLAASGHSPSISWDVLHRAIGGFHLFLLGHRPYENFFQASPPGNSLYPAAFWAAFIFCALLPAFRKNLPSRKTVLGLLSLFVVMQIMSVVSHVSRIQGTPRDSQYMFVFFPFPQIVLALAFSQLFALLRERRFLRGLTIVFLVSFCYGEARLLADYFHRMKETGAGRRFTDAVHDVGEWLRLHPTGRRPVWVMSSDLADNLYCIDPRIKTTVIGSVTEHPLFLCREEDFFPLWEKRLSEQSDRELLIVNDNCGYANYQKDFDLIKSWALQRRKKFGPVAQFRDKDGTVVFEAYLLELGEGEPSRRTSPPGTAGTAPFQSPVDNKKTL